MLKLVRSISGQVSRQSSARSVHTVRQILSKHSDYPELFENNNSDLFSFLVKTEDLKRKEIARDFPEYNEMANTVFDHLLTKRYMTSPAHDLLRKIHLEPVNVSDFGSLNQILRSDRKLREIFWKQTIDLENRLANSDRLLDKIEFINGNLRDSLDLSFNYELFIKNGLTISRLIRHAIKIGQPSASESPPTLRLNVGLQQDVRYVLGTLTSYPSPYIFCKYIRDKAIESHANPVDYVRDRPYLENTFQLVQVAHRYQPRFIESSRIDEHIEKLHNPRLDPTEIDDIRRHLGSNADEYQEYAERMYRLKRDYEVTLDEDFPYETKEEYILVLCDTMLKRRMMLSVINAEIPHLWFETRYSYHFDKHGPDSSHMLV